jgi:DNA-directed RNA polymerase specialized sigma24 family protein
MSGSDLNRAEKGIADLSDSEAYAYVYEKYFDQLHSYARTFYPCPEYARDKVSDFLLRQFSHGYYSLYDPTGASEFVWLRESLKKYLCSDVKSGAYRVNVSESQPAVYTDSEDGDTTEYLGTDEMRSEDIDAHELVRVARKRLEELDIAHGEYETWEDDGTRVKHRRTLLALFDLLLKGKSCVEIAETFKVSKSVVIFWIHELWVIEEILNIALFAQGKPLLEPSSKADIVVRTTRVRNDVGEMMDWLEYNIGWNQLKWILRDARCFIHFCRKFQDIIAQVEQEQELVPA